MVYVYKLFGIWEVNFFFPHNSLYCLLQCWQRLKVIGVFFRRRITGASGPIVLFEKPWQATLVYLTEVRAIHTNQ